MATILFGDFEWDDAKAASNLAKHGVSFEDAAVALLEDPNAVPYPDGLGNLVSLVLSVVPAATRVLLVVTIERSPRTRIIGARKATPHEQRIYEEG